MKASDLLDLNDLRTKVVTVPGWNKKVTIRELGLDEGIKLFSLAKGDEENMLMGGDAIAQVVAWGVIDPDTLERVFADEDVEKLSKKSSKALMYLYQQIVSLSGDDIEKN